MVMSQAQRIASAKKAAKTIKTKGSSEDFSIKIEVMRKFTKYSKDKLTCKCCKENFQPHFLTMDHIFGRKEISKIKELKKIDYNENRSADRLLRWINKHFDKNKKIIFTHFQPLCWNCNTAKGLYKTCPHQRKS